MKGLYVGMLWGPSVTDKGAVKPLHIALLDYRDVTHPEAGGAEAYLNEIFQRIAARGHRVTLICARYEGASTTDRVGEFRVIRVGNKATVNFLAARAALRLARNEGVDLFVENICKIPFLMPMLTRIPVLPIIPHLFGHTVFYETNPVFASYVWMYERLIPRVYRGRRFVVISESTAADLVARGVRARVMDVVYCGIELDKYRSAPAPPPSEDALVVYVGRLKRYKGLDVVLQAVGQLREKVPALKLVIVGRGDDQSRLESLVQSLDLAGIVTFTGYVSEEEKINWLRRADVAVYPSPREGWGIAAVEAAACGTAVVASNSDGLRDAVRDGETGFLVPHRDPGRWAARLAEILSDESLQARMGQAGREWAARFNWDAEADKMLTVVREIVAEGVGGRNPE